MRPALLGLAALLSGFAALVWQSLWIRRLSLAFGHTAFAVNAVLAIFFTGLGLGAFLLGRTADRRRASIDRGDPAAAKGAAEILLRIEAQRHAGLYISALVALRNGDSEGARLLVQKALEFKPDQRGSIELVEGLDRAPVAPR